jgi:hypothetical protein
MFIMHHDKGMDVTGIVTMPWKTERKRVIPQTTSHCAAQIQKITSRIAIDIRKQHRKEAGIG